MQERHTDRKQYFEEQGVVTQKYVIPFIEEIIPITSDLVIAEIGCGEAGNVQPFVEMGCKVYGIDIHHITAHGINYGTGLTNVVYSSSGESWIAGIVENVAQPSGSSIVGHGPGQRS